MMNRTSNTFADFDEITEESRREILEERARQLSRAQAIGEELDHNLELLEFSIFSEHYAIEIGYIKEVTRLRELAMLPCTPDTLVGLMNFRGQILPVLDIADLLEVKRPRDASGNLLLPSGDRKVLVLQVADAHAGIAVDDVIGITAIANSSLQAPGFVCSAARASVLKGIREDQLAVIDVESILRDSRVQVNETV